MPRDLLNGDLVHSGTNEDLPNFAIRSLTAVISAAVLLISHLVADRGIVSHHPCRGVVSEAVYFTGRTPGEPCWLSGSASGAVH